MANNLEIDASEFLKGLGNLASGIENTIPKNLELLGHEIIRLSNKEVPIHTVPGEPGGALQNSSFVDRDGEGAVIGYNIAYAAYQHEGRRADGTHIVKNYTNPRSKAKYLEDPIKNNISKWRGLLIDLLNQTIRGNTR